MKSHVIRPVYVVLGLVATIILARFFVVPKDFGVYERGYMYSWHRKANEDDWKTFKVKYMTAEYCKDCHTEEHSLHQGSPHARIECENCHGPSAGHPEDPVKLPKDKSRDMCLRCHSKLPYLATERRLIPGILQDEHNPGVECASCHNPHNPAEGIK